MITIAVVAGMLVAAVMQVAFAPYFPIGGATFDVPLIALVLILRLRGPRTTMVALPVLAVWTAFLLNRSAALMLIGYLPLLPLAFWLDESGPPVGAILRTLAVTVVTGGWARFVLSLGVIGAGADPALSVLVWKVLLPGFFLDLALLVVAYVPLRFIGWEARSTRLQRGGFSAYERL
ncbi:hypothetical protein AYO38_08275 [bacterium SCGC AG-212-C10]|nr:hypothetical protein AYO38_08275 [bacterium SCGC AG-212-C10]